MPIPLAWSRALVSDPTYCLCCTEEIQERPLLEEGECGDSDAGGSSGEGDSDAAESSAESSGEGHSCANYVCDCGGGCGCVDQAKVLYEAHNEQVLRVGGLIYSQIDQILDGLVIKKLVDEELFVWAVIMALIVLLPQLVIWSFLRYHRMADVAAVGRILFFPSLVLAIVSIVRSLPDECVSPGTRRLIVSHVVCATGFSVEQMYHLKKAVFGEDSRGSLWVNVGEGIMEASCSSVFTLYVMFLRRDTADKLFLASIVGSILSITKTATQLHFFGTKTSKYRTSWGSG